jgi:hypothetical protein
MVIPILIAQEWHLKPGWASIACMPHQRTLNTQPTEGMDTGHGDTPDPTSYTRMTTFSFKGIKFIG